MLRLTNLANKYQRRTLRALYAQTQAYPFDATLDSAFDRDTMFNPAGAVGAQKAAIIPGLVATKLAGEVVTLSDASTDDRAFGLFANFVGGQLSDIPDDFDKVGVWRGAGGVFELLAPAFDGDTTSPVTLGAAEDGSAAKEVYMQTNSVGQLVGNDSAFDVLLAADGPPVARLLSALSANAIIVELLV